MTLAIESNIPLAPMTTLGIGGPAKFFVRATTVDEIREAVEWANANRAPIFFLAGGSNLLIADRGFDGLVVKIDLRGIVSESETEVKVAAGEPWDDFVAFAVERGLAGIECLSGIPGTAGATPIQNVGAYGQDVGETIVRVEALERASGRVVWLTNDECRFGYRSSLFKNIERERFVVLSVTYRLTPGGAAAVRYPELRQYLDTLGIDDHDLRGVRGAVIAIRKRKGMVIDPTDPDTRSDGSFFMNPVIPASQLTDPAMPHYPAGDNVKLSAAWLIEHAGFQKGFVHKNTGLSSKHTLAIINRGNATAAEVIELVEMIKRAVRDRFGVELDVEPNFVGFAVSS
jgi:UDP-N-acetylmuramate dehydrogenase